VFDEAEGEATYADFITNSDESIAVQRGFIRDDRWEMSNETQRLIWPKSDVVNGRYLRPASID
jgi:hypothetical protein